MFSVRLVGADYIDLEAGLAYWRADFGIVAGRYPKPTMPISMLPNIFSLLIHSRHLLYSAQMNFNPIPLRSVESFTPMGLSISSFCRSPFVSPLAYRAALKLDFLFTARCFFIIPPSSSSMQGSNPRHLRPAVLRGVELYLPLFPFLIEFNKIMFGRSLPDL